MVRRMIACFLSLLQLVLCGVSSGTRKEDPLAPPQPQTVQDIRGSCPLADTVLYASQAANAVQAFYTSKDRKAYSMQNRQMTLTHTLSGKYKAASLVNAEGKAYLRGPLDAFYTAKGVTRYADPDHTEVRVNTIRLGAYYYETHLRDFDFSANDFMLDKAFHVYADRLYMQYSLYAKEATTALEDFGSEICIPARKVRAVRICDANGTHADPAQADADTTVYAAFDIRDAGVLGFVIPQDGGRVTVQRMCGMYVLRLYAPFKAGTGVNKFDETGGYALNCVTFGCRIVTDTAHDFAAVEDAAREEREPLTVTVGANDSDAAFVGYNALRGTYDISIAETDFAAAYNDPDRQFRAPITVTGADTDRTVWLRVTSTGGGCLEAAAMLDADNALLPVPMQVCKNFCGDFGEPAPYYYTAKDYAYGDSFSPLTVHAGETAQCTVVHLSQNWGKFPLKQLSSIEFHTSYYHLSTGTTESNCIAPYSVYGRDGWLLPDFRGRSGDMWPEQPQFNSVGRLYFAQQKRFGKTQTGEYQSARIDSVGQTYADLTTQYVSDDGSYRYTLRHFEYPQTDENRTYYTLDLTFTRTASYRDFRGGFDLFRFDGRSVTFDRMGYLNADNEPVRAETADGTHCFTLGSDCPYYSFFDVSDETRGQIEQRFGSCFGLIVRGSEITMNGRKAEIPLCLRTRSESGLTEGTLTLDIDRVTFHAGDRIRLELILLPWGTGYEEHDDNVRAVRHDSALHPVRVSAESGSVIADSILPRVRCADNEAQFTVTGGKNNIAVRVDGFTDLRTPALERRTDSGWEAVELASANGYDGCTVHYNADGTYGFSFVFSADDPAQAHTFRMRTADA